MPREDQVGVLRVNAIHPGTIEEATAFLHDLENAYNRIHSFFGFVDLFDPETRRFRRRLRIWRGIRIPPYLYLPLQLPSDQMLPEQRLAIHRVRLESPGFWEVIGSLNPLQQIREYLNDRHGRRQDKEYREHAEREKLAIENDLIQREVWEKENAILGGRIDVMRDLGFSDEEIRQLVWSNVSRPLIDLGAHQDKNLIEDAE